MRRWLQSLPPWVPVLLLLLLSCIAFWKFRIIDPAPIQVIGPLAADHYTGHHPDTTYGFRALRSGVLPLWNPYQLTGTPHLAVPHSGLFYPGNWIYLLVDSSVGTEISYVLHLVFAGLCFWLFARALTFSRYGALAASFTFIWNGWLATYCNQPALVTSMCWLPATVLLIEKVIRGSSLAGFGLVLAVACQVFNGATEYTTQNLMVGGLYAAFRLAWLTWGGDFAEARIRGALLLLCVAVGVLLTSFQLLPSIELATQSGRMTASFTLDEAIQGASIAPAEFFESAIRSSGMVSVGLLPFLGLAFGLGNPRLRRLWFFAAGLGAVAVLLVFGGKLFELYHLTPIGSLFRRPHKFLHVYAFAQALMAGLALTRLEDWTATVPARLWSKPSWLVGIGLLVATLIWMAIQDENNAYLAGTFLLLLGFASTVRARPRHAIIVALLLLHSTQLFLAAKNVWVRPYSEPGVFDSHAALFAQLREDARESRIHISHNYLSYPGLVQKQGMLQGVKVVGGHGALVTDRVSQFFTRVAPLRHGLFGAPQARFMGMIALDAESRFKLLDLASTRFYVVSEKKKLGRTLSRAARNSAESHFQLHATGPDGLAVFERTTAIPRAYHVEDVRLATGVDEILDTLEAADFVPGESVVLEKSSAAETSAGSTDHGAAEIQIRLDEPERVVVEIVTTQPGYLVLNDAYYPGWRAFVDGAEVEILRANLIFRAVKVPSGTVEVRFEYWPVNFNAGITMSLAAAGGFLLVAAIVSSRREQ